MTSSILPVWVVADFVASSDVTVSQKAMARLSKLAIESQFDRPSKKIDVLRRVAKAQARLGDYDGAYRTLGEPRPFNNVQSLRATKARMGVMKAVAEAQLSAKKPDAARATAQAALERIGALPDEDAESYLPLEELGLIQARTGDVAGADRTAGRSSSTARRVKILTRIAEVQAESGRRDLARATIARRRDEARRAPNEALWERMDTPEHLQAFQLMQMDPIFPVLQTIAVAQARIGDLDDAIKTASDIGDPSVVNAARNSTVEQIVEAALKAGDAKGALKAVALISGSISSSGEKDRLLEQIARRQASSGDPSAVLEWVRKEKAPDAKLKSLRGLADGISERLAPKETKPDDSAPKTGSIQQRSNSQCDTAEDVEIAERTGTRGRPCTRLDLGCSLLAKGAIARPGVRRDNEVLLPFVPIASTARGLAR